MTFILFSQVQLIQDIPEFNLKKGSIGVIVEYYPMSQEEDGYSVEGLIAQETVEVAESQIQVIEFEFLSKPCTFI
ncbi:DUF4926 domain-containing protein [Okeania sp. SIO1I7]|uniref:DUF4926 domain-containing protein n=1 Tax=Okeania sp. SIO1I7 TaxID=2607772 RepID=UPI0013FBF8EE|nr:DUF4926 domain-containing protein [Okeania sp. SIO1I7]NET25474.1 DUF4926 domain-containing protein [Okeania sp. SIO1I7]